LDKKKIKIRGDKPFNSVPLREFLCYNLAQNLIGVPLHILLWKIGFPAKPNWYGLELYAAEWISQLKSSQRLVPAYYPNSLLDLNIAKNYIFKYSMFNAW
jgi:hypothetical protein